MKNAAVICLILIFAVLAAGPAAGQQEKILTDKEVEQLLKEKLRNNPPGFPGGTHNFPSPARPVVESPGIPAPFIIIVAAIFGLAIFRILKGAAETRSMAGSVRERYKDALKKSEQAEQKNQAPPAPGGYNCKSCGAGLPPGAEVSPSGDVKCSYCNTWFNIHK